jgi:hypothetical protein
MRLSLNKIKVLTAVMNQSLRVMMMNMTLLMKEISLSMHHGTIPEAMN